LFYRELVERHILVDSVNHPVAIQVGIRSRQILLVAVAVGVASKVEPVSPPSLAIVGGGKQAVHQTFIGIRSPVVHKRLNVRRCRQQPQQIKGEPPNQRAPVGFGRWRDALLFQSRENESVNGVAHPRLVFHRWDWGARRWDERPVRRAQGVGRIFRPLRPLINPCPQPTNLRGGEAVAGGRHDRLFQTGDVSDEPTVRAVARHDDRALRAALHRVVFAVKTQAAHLLLVAVTHKTLLCEDGLHVSRKVDFGWSRWRKLGRLHLVRGFGCFDTDEIDAN